MRLPLIAPSDLDADQKPLYDEMHAAVSKSFGGFETMRSDGALLGPWSVWLHDPEVGAAFFGVTKALGTARRLPDAARQLAILVVGARYRPRYELYAHGAVALTKNGMMPARLAAIVSGSRPVDLDPEEGAAYDVAAALVAGGPLPDAVYDHALDVFGQPALNELIFLVAHYAFIGLVLNGFDVPAPERSAN